MREKLIFIHGIASQKTGYSDGLYNRILGLLPDSRAKELSQCEILWSDCTSWDISSYLQTQYRDRPGLWQFITEGVDPLVAQLGIYAADKEAHGPILRRIQDGFTAALADNPDCITVIGHSLGSVIAFDYLMGFKEAWHLPESVKVRALITMGSPIPLFTTMMRHPVSDVTLPPNIGQWDNLIDPHDGVARFCKPHFYRMDNMRDVLVNSGFWMISSHCGYWSSKSTAKAIAEGLINPQLRCII